MPGKGGIEVKGPNSSGNTNGDAAGGNGGNGNSPGNGNVKRGRRGSTSRVTEKRRKNGGSGPNNGSSPSQSPSRNNENNINSNNINGNNSNTNSNSSNNLDGVHDNQNLSDESSRNARQLPPNRQMLLFNEDTSTRPTKLPDHYDFDLPSENRGMDCFQFFLAVSLLTPKTLEQRSKALLEVLSGSLTLHDLPFILEKISVGLERICGGALIFDTLP